MQRPNLGLASPQFMKGRAMSNNNQTGQNNASSEDEVMDGKKPSNKSGSGSKKVSGAKQGGSHSSKSSDHRHSS